MAYKILYTVVFLWWVFMLYCTYAGLKSYKFTHFTKYDKIKAYIIGPLSCTLLIYFFGLVIIYIWSN